MVLSGDLKKTSKNAYIINRPSNMTLYFQKREKRREIKHWKKEGMYK